MLEDSDKKCQPLDICPMRGKLKRRADSKLLILNSFLQSITSLSKFAEWPINCISHRQNTKKIVFGEYLGEGTSPQEGEAVFYASPFLEKVSKRALDERVRNRQGKKSDLCDINRQAFP